jgi:hypothetical protein
MPTGTYEPIATYTFPSDSQDYTFSSIPQTYDDLVVIGANITCNGTQTMYIRCNGDTGANYSWSNLYTPNSYGVSLASTKTLLNTAGMQIGSVSSGMSTTKTGGFIFQMNQYSQSSYPKVGVSTWNQADEEGTMIASNWNNTNAVTSITIRSSSSTIKIGSRFTIYGIKKAV